MLEVLQKDAGVLQKMLKVSLNIVCLYAEKVLVGATKNVGMLK